MGDEGYVVAIGEADLALERAIGLKFGPAVAGGFFAFVVAVPVELNVIVMAGAVDRAGEAIEGELAALFAELDIGIRPGHVPARCLDDTPSTQHPHAGAASSLGSRTRL